MVDEPTKTTTTSSVDNFSITHIHKVVMPLTSSYIEFLSTCVFLFFKDLTNVFNYELTCFDVFSSEKTESFSTSTADI
jgi:hypothetical protein